MLEKSVTSQKSKQLKFSLWIEKYRPMSVNQVLLTPSNKEFFLKLVQQKEIPNLLFVSSSPGTGKTTTAKALANDIKSDWIYINMSLESGIETLRNRISKFATSYSMFGENEGGKKIAILDEFDGSTQTLQAAMRGFMEEFQDSCRFILTCNYATKIIDPLKSRCQIVDFNVTDIKSQEQLKPIILKRLCGILKTENVQFQNETIEKLINNFYPDIRRMVNLLQQYSKKSGIIDVGIFDVEKVDQELYELILNKKLTDARKYVIEKNYNCSEIYRQLFDNFIPMLEKPQQAQAILVIAEYLWRDSQGIHDKEINLAACFIQLMSII
jgi:DNA polymerase III delta prime subunit